MSKTNLDSELDEMLASLNGIKRAEVSEDFEKRLFQRVSFLPRRESHSWLRYCAAAMLLLALCNGYFLMKSFGQKQEEEQVLSESFIYQYNDYTEFE